MLRSSIVAAVAVVLLSAGCSSSDPGPNCPAAGPTFRVTLTAMPGPLPPDTRLEVKYGAGVEQYPGNAGKSVFCHDVPGDPDAGARDAISCDLWTSGAADVTVTATGYATIERTLMAVRDDCGIQLTEVAIELEKPD
jgi:hypothetical protein